MINGATPCKCLAQKGARVVPPGNRRATARHAAGPALEPVYGKGGRLADGDLLPDARCGQEWFLPR